MWLWGVQPEFSLEPNNFFVFYMLGPNVDSSGCLAQDFEKVKWELSFLVFVGFNEVFVNVYSAL